MLELAGYMKALSEQLSEFRQETRDGLGELRKDTQDTRERVVRLETEVAALKNKRNGDWVRYVWNFVSVLVGALLALVGVRMQGG
jgi:chromosome segregation ATPase